MMPSTITNNAFAFIAASLVSISVAHGQESEEEGFGFLEMVNLISLNEPTHFTFGGYKVASGNPIPSGRSAGYATIKANSYSFTVSNAEAKPKVAEGEITIKKNRNSKIVFFDTVKEFKDGSKEHKLRYTVLTEAEKSKGAQLTLVSLLNEKFSSALINGQAGPADGRKPFHFPIKLGDRISIEAAGSKMDSFEIDDKIHYLCFLFLNPETGEADLSVVKNEKLEYHPPREDNDADEENEAESSGKSDE